MVAVLVSLAKSSIGLSSVPCIQFGPLVEQSVHTSYIESRELTGQPYGQAHRFDITDSSLACVKPYTAG